MQHKAKAKEMRSTNIDFPTGIPIGTTRPKVGSAGAGGSEEKGGRADEVGAAEVDAAEGERDPKGSPQ